MDKEKLINLIKNVDDDNIIRYLYALNKDYIERNDAKQIIKQCELKNGLNTDKIGNFK